jgi:hypothetical protein
MYVDRPTPLLAQNDRRRVGKMGAQKAPAAAHGRAGGHFPAAGNQKVGGWHVGDKRNDRVRARRQRIRKAFLESKTERLKAILRNDLRRGLQALGFRVFPLMTLSRAGADF